LIAHEQHFIFRDTAPSERELEKSGLGFPDARIHRCHDPGKELFNASTR
jgi:hypothetical protein